MSLSESILTEARDLINKGEWVPITLTPPLNEGTYLVTLEEYEYPMIAHFYPSEEPGLKPDGGYWMNGVCTLNDYGIAAWKPSPERYNIKGYYERVNQQNERLREEGVLKD